MKVSEIMRRPVVVVRESDSLEQAAALMLENDVRGLPVVDDKGKIRGFVSVSDFFAKEEPFPFSQQSAPQLFGKWVPKEGIEQIYEEARSLPVRDIMHAPAVTVEEDATIEELVDLMLNRGLNRIPVVRDGIPVGMIARFDLLKIMMFKAKNGGKDGAPDREKGP